MSGPYVLATSCSEPDREFASLAQLAAAVIDLRDALPDRHALALHRAQLTRCELPGGHVLAVRALDGSCGGRGSALGYVFLADYGREADALRRMIATPQERAA